LSGAHRRVCRNNIFICTAYHAEEVCHPEFSEGGKPSKRLLPIAIGNEPLKQNNIIGHS